MHALQRIGLLVSAAAALVLAGCGGSGGDAPAAAPAPQTPGTPSVIFVAVGSSDRTASLGWTRPAASATYVIERRAAGGDWTAVASVDARSGGYLDTGLAAQTDYTYRLVETGAARTTLAESTITTTNETPVTTPAGAAVAAAVTTSAGSAGVELAAPDGAIVVKVPAGALASDTSATLQPVTNTAPGGRGNGLNVRFAAAPAATLTLTVRYDAAQDGEADGQGIALQRGDGTWISLPVLALDKTARTLTAELPAALLAPAAAQAALAPLPHSGSAAGALAGARTAAAGVSLAFTVVRYLAFYLDPGQARVAVNKSLRLKPFARVYGYELTIGSCRAGAGASCVMQPLMETREIAFLNSKPGFDRRWYVFLEEGGDATYGTVAPSGAAGATYKAPGSVPSPATVLVTFQSRDLATGRTVTLTAQVEITPDRWVGTMTAVNGPSSAGTTFTAVADVTWDLDAIASTDTRRVYRAIGTVGVTVTDDNCVVTVSPPSQPVAANPLLVELVLDESASPAAYTIRLIAFWPATISAVCKQGSGSNPTPGAGYGWDVSGVVSGNGDLIEGKQNDQNGAQVDWSFTRPTS